MNISISPLKINQTFPFLQSSSKIHQISLGGRSLQIRVQPRCNKRFYSILVAECSKRNSIECKPEDEEWIKEVLDEKWIDKCGERQSMEEFIECLEREVIMGEDEGKDASDYKRRAHIFNKSDRVFKAIKEKQNLNVD